MENGKIVIYRTADGETSIDVNSMAYASADGGAFSKGSIGNSSAYQKCF